MREHHLADRGTTPNDAYGVTRGTFVAEAETYGADKLWVVLKPISIELHSLDEDEDAVSLPPSSPPSLPLMPRASVSLEGEALVRPRPFD